MEVYHTKLGQPLIPLLLISVRKHLLRVSYQVKKRTSFEKTLLIEYQMKESWERVFERIPTVAEEKKMKLVDSKNPKLHRVLVDLFSLSSAIRNFTYGNNTDLWRDPWQSKSFIWLIARVILVSLRYGNRRLPPVPLPSKTSIGQRLRFGTATLASIVSGRKSQ